MFDHLHDYYRYRNQSNCVHSNSPIFPSGITDTLYIRRIESEEKSRTLNVEFIEFRLLSQWQSWCSVIQSWDRNCGSQCSTPLTINTNTHNFFFFRKYSRKRIQRAVTRSSVSTTNRIAVLSSHGEPLNFTSEQERNIYFQVRVLNVISFEMMSFSRATLPHGHEIVVEFLYIETTDLTE